MARSKKNSGSRPDKTKSIETSAEDVVDDALASDTPSEGGLADETLDETLDDVLKTSEDDPKVTPASDSPTGDDAAGEIAETPETPETAGSAEGAGEDSLAASDDAEAATDLVKVEGAERMDHDILGDQDEPAKTDAPPVMPPVAPQAEGKSGPGFIPLVIGGLVAGAIGYSIPTFFLPTGDDSAARFEALEAQIAAIPAPETPDLSAITAEQEALRTDIDALTDRVAALEAAPASTGPATGASTAATSTGAGARADIAALASRTDGVETALTDLTGRVVVLETGFAEASGAAASVVAEAEALARQAAQNQIALALQSGAPFAEQVDILGDVPADLVAVAEDGVVTQDTLIADFPPLAREALRLARSGESGGGMGSLFRNAFNPRSLEPREGDDPDAVLSRAEAAVRGGDIAAALTEMEGLPAEAAAPLADWRARAETRAAALAAADAYLSDG